MRLEHLHCADLALDVCGNEECSDSCAVYAGNIVFTKSFRGAALGKDTAESITN